MSPKKLGFGLMRLPLSDPDDHGSIDMPQFAKMVDMFLERGFTYFDTAYMYHDFKSETAAREAIVKRHPRDSFTLTSKMPLALMDADTQESVFAEQLAKCGVDYFDYYWLHAMTQSNWEKAKKWNSFEFLSRKKAEGKTRHIGFSYHDNAELLDEILTAHPETEYVQLQLNYLDWENESIQSRKCYEVCVKHGKPVVVMEPVKGGTLANVPEKAAKMLKDARPDLSVASWGVRFAASFDNVFMVLSGMSSLEQLDDNTSYMRDFKPLDAEERKALEGAVGVINESVVIPCTACRYCTKGCPKNIPIPDYFSLYNNHKLATMKGFSTQKFYYDNRYTKFGKASDCVGCRQCERVCPQRIGVVKWLKEVAATFEG